MLLWPKAPTTSAVAPKALWADIKRTEDLATANAIRRYEDTVLLNNTLLLNDTIAWNEAVARAEAAERAAAAAVRSAATRPRGGPRSAGGESGGCGVPPDDGAAPAGFPDSVIQRESGGDRTASNGSHIGRAQIACSHYGPGGGCVGLSYSECWAKLWDGGAGASNWAETIG